MSSLLRKLKWRLGRKFYSQARGECDNNPKRNGEYWLLEKIVSSSGNGDLFLDVGANKGEWTAYALNIAKNSNIVITLFPFEPSPGTRTLLNSRFENHPTVSVQSFALSSESGKLKFYSNGIGSGTNSLSDVSGVVEAEVDVATLDDFVAMNQLYKIKMVKIDTEGFDFNVIKGSEKCLSDGSIEVIQFEYNWRWLLNHFCLRDVFMFIKDKPYVFGKLTGNKILLFKNWHFELDRFFENNYVLVHKDSKLLSNAIFSEFDESNVY